MIKKFKISLIACAALILPAILIETDVQANSTDYIQNSRAVDYDKGIEQKQAADNESSCTDSLSNSSTESSTDEPVTTTDLNESCNQYSSEQILTTNQPLFWDYQWDMKLVTDDGKSYSEVAKTDSSDKNIVSVAEIDSGITIDHPDLNKSIGSHNENFVPKGGFENNEENETGEITNVTDSMGHGTEVAGQIVANGNIKGVAPGIPINSYRIFGDSLAKPEWIASAIKKAADDGNKVINISSGQYLMITGEYADGTNDYKTYLTYKSAIDYAVNKGCIVVAALGNDGLDIQNNKQMLDFLGQNKSIKTPGIIIDAPSAFENVISVGGIDQNLNISDFSNVDINAIYAPAGSTKNLKRLGETDFINQGYYLKDFIYTSSNQGWYQYVYGNSFAAPKVAGAVALFLQKFGIHDFKYTREFLVSRSPIVNNVHVLNVYNLLKYSLNENISHNDKDTSINNNKTISQNQNLLLDIKDTNFNVELRKMNMSSVIGAAPREKKISLPKAGVSKTYINIVLYVLVLWLVIFYMTINKIIRDKNN